MDAVVIGAICYILGICFEKVYQKLTSTHGTFALSCVDDESAVGIKFDKRITEDTNKIVLTKSR